MIFQHIEPLIEYCCVYLIRQFIVPKHIALVADGARRFGKKYKISVQENHEIGLYKVMLEMTDWCLELGISEYSILMYSLGNYYRPPDEVNHWIDILRIWLMKCIEHWKTLEEKGIRLNIFGKLKRIPEDVNVMLAVLVLLTKDNNKVVVTMAMGYTGKHELSTVSYEILKASKNGVICQEDLTIEFYNKCLFTYGCHDPDLMIRTSGYKRISNFLIWQVSKACIYFIDVLWPDFSKFDFLRAVFYYQRSTSTNHGVVEMCDCNNFYKVLNEKRKWELIEYAVKAGVVPTLNLQELLVLNYDDIYSYYNSKCAYNANFFNPLRIPYFINKNV